MDKKKSMHLVSLGCPKNLVDSEVMLAVLENEGYRVVKDPGQADLLVVNTCGFIQPAVEEAVDEILRLAEFKQPDNQVMLVVCGCLVQRYGKELLLELPEVDLFIGINELDEIGELIRKKKMTENPVIQVHPPRFLMDSQTPRRQSTPFFQAYMKITEGCDNHCSFCLIPSIRGNLRSRSISDLIIEAQRFDRQGVRELNLIAQDLTAYGDDVASDVDLTTLLHQIVRETDIPWIRLLYLYPGSIDEELLALMASEPRIVPYLDIPIQHVSDRILKRMNRHYGQEDLENLIENIRRYLPDCSLRTTLLVGFPGETDNDIELLLDCLERWQLDHVGVFQYQDEPGCSAHQLGGKIDEHLKKERYTRIMKAQTKFSYRNMQRFVGKEEAVLVNGVSVESDLLLEGRTRFQASEIDGCVYIADGQANPGDIVSVAISEAHTYDLVGNIVR